MISYFRHDIEIYMAPLVNNSSRHQRHAKTGRHDMALKIRHYGYELQVKILLKRARRPRLHESSSSVAKD